MLRLVIVLLVIANAGYFAWTQGYLVPLGLAPTEQAEPERLRAQIKPEALRLLNGPKDTPAPATAPAAEPAPTTAPAVVDSASDIPAPTATVAEPAATSTTVTVAPVQAPAPEAPATACWLAGGFSTAQADTLRAALTASELPRSSWQLVETRTGGRWVIYMGRYSEEQLDKKKAELKELGVSFRSLPPPMGPGLALGTFSSEAAAEQGLQDVAKKGVRTARVAIERAEGSAWTLRLPAITDAQRATVAGLGAALAGKRLQACE